MAFTVSKKSRLSSVATQLISALWLATANKLRVQLAGDWVTVVAFILGKAVSSFGKIAYSPLGAGHTSMAADGRH